MKLVLVILFISFNAFAETTLKPTFSDTKPDLDGKFDSAWYGAKPIEVKRLDFDVPIKIRSIIHHNTIYFLIEWKDENVNNLHKPWKWDGTKNTNVVGKEREDSLTIRWGINIGDYEQDNNSNDIWYWGSVRSNNGYADDLYEKSSKKPLQKGLEKKDFDGRTYYLQTQGDFGTRSWTTGFKESALGLNEKNRYKPQTPKGSRADVKCVAKWEKNIVKEKDVALDKYVLVDKSYWTLEVSRKLVTGNYDDINFYWGQEYFFDITANPLNYAHVIQNISIMKDDATLQEWFPLKLKMPSKSLEVIKPLNEKIPVNEKD